MAMFMRVVASVCLGMAARIASGEVIVGVLVNIAIMALTYQAPDAPKEPRP